MLLVRIIIFLLGLLLVITTVESAFVTFVLPRGDPNFITSTLFRLVRRCFDFRLRWVDTYLERDRVMALYAPISLLLLVPLWLTLILIGYAGMYWATGMASLTRDLIFSGSSLFTLGFATGDNPFHAFLAFSEAAIGLILIAVLIAYLPTMYSAFARRELAVNQLAVRAGTPPSAVELILRANRIGALSNMRAFWVQWETWFAEVEENHTSLAALVFFRSPQPEHSWITAAGAVLDSAALIASTVDMPRQPQAELCIRAGYLCLQRITDYFGIAFNRAPLFPAEPISITREEYDAVYEQFVASGVPVKPDREQAWRAFAGWRVNYDRVLLTLAALTMAPYAPWSSDRSVYTPVPLLRKGKGNR